MELGHLLIRSGLTYPEASSKVCHDSFCQLGNSVSLPWVIYYGAFYLHVVSSFYCIPVICLKFGVIFNIELKYILFNRIQLYFIQFYSIFSLIKETKYLLAKFGLGSYTVGTVSFEIMCLNLPYILFLHIPVRAVGWGTVLQIGRSRVLFPIV